MPARGDRFLCAWAAVGERWRPGVATVVSAEGLRVRGAWGRWRTVPWHDVVEVRAAGALTEVPWVRVRDGGVVRLVGLPPAASAALAAAQRGAPPR